MPRVAALVTSGLLVCVAYAQVDPNAPRAIDACGVLVQGAECVLFEGGGGRYVLSDYGDFKVSDTVRVVGTIDPNCATICLEGDGCIRGATLYDPAVFPCGQRIPSFPEDLLIDACAAASAALPTLTLAGLVLAGRRNGR